MNFFAIYSAVVSLCQRTNFQCDNSPTFVLQNSVPIARNFAVQRLANCHSENLFFDRVTHRFIYLILLFTDGLQDLDPIKIFNRLPDRNGSIRGESVSKLVSCTTPFHKDCPTKMQYPILYSYLLNKMGLYFLDTQYTEPIN